MRIVKRLEEIYLKSPLLSFTIVYAFEMIPNEKTKKIDGFDVKSGFLHCIFFSFPLSTVSIKN